MEYRRYGPPGCGKTESIRRDCEHAAEKYGGSNVMVMSFTRAAATEIRGRIDSIPQENAGTLHHFARAALGKPAIASGKVINDFNDANPQWKLSVEGDKTENAFDRHIATQGDGVLAELEVLRQKMVPEREWPKNIQIFNQAWSDFKRQCDLCDFTDLIERAYLDCESVPSKPAIMFFDEAQDSPPLELALVRKWGSHAEKLILVGDDDQSIYAWRGATPESFLNPPIDEDHKFRLKQSWRCPRAVQDLATHWIERVAVREPKEWAPRQADGELIRFDRSFRDPAKIVGLAVEHEKQGTVMIQATCDYMLTSIIRELKDRGVPFHNPYRQEDGQWNPLRRGIKGKTSALERVLAFLIPDWGTAFSESRVWSRHDFHLWASALTLDGLFIRGSGEWIRSMKGDATEMRAIDFVEHILPERRAELDRIAFVTPDDTRGALEWFRSNLSAKCKTCAYPSRIAEDRGGMALAEVPRILVGTCHSFKGGEADTVILAPDLSMAGYKQWNGPRDARDGVVRLFYVAMTRAFERLVICQPSGPLNVAVN